MTITANDIIVPASQAVADGGQATWEPSQWLEFVHAAVVATAGLLPEYVAVTVDHALVAGVQQAIPADGFRFLRCLQNTTGAGVMPLDMAKVRRMNPAFTAATGSATVKGVGFDPALPRTFYVFPPALVGASLSLVYAQTPPALALTTDALPLPDALAPALVEYALFRAHSTVYGGESDRAARHLETWKGLVTVWKAGVAGGAA